MKIVVFGATGSVGRLIIVVCALGTVVLMEYAATLVLGGRP